jgi:predicted nuclease of predicted toxin-antitoxin system
MKILLDMNLPLKLADLLTEKGIETAHWFNIGAPNAKDSIIMEYARKNDYIVASYDLDFSAILAVTHGQKPSVVQIRAQDLQTERTAEMIVFALRQNADELEKGAILSIDTKRARVRLLPL